MDRFQHENMLTVLRIITPKRNKMLHNALMFNHTFFLCVHSFRWHALYELSIIYCI